MAKKIVNQALVDFAVEARRQNMTYGQLQVQETCRRLRKEREREKNGCKRILTADNSTETEHS
jgi:hypothetical protein